MKLNTSFYFIHFSKHKDICTNDEKKKKRLNVGIRVS